MQIAIPPNMRQYRSILRKCAIFDGWSGVYLLLAEMPTCLLIQAVNPHDIFHQADTNS